MIRQKDSAALVAAEGSISCAFPSQSQVQGFVITRAFH